MLRNARITDAEAIWQLINHYARQEKMLAISLAEIYSRLRDFSVVEIAGAVVGVAALHLLDADLAEIRSLAVTEKFQAQGWGKTLITAKLQEAKELGIKRVLVLTYLPQLFSKLGFKPVDKLSLPHKVWLDCIKCPKFPHCDEQALIYQNQ